MACPLAGEAAQGGADAFRGGRGVVAGGPVGGGDPGRVGADGGDARPPVGAIGEVGGNGGGEGGEGRLPARECPGLELADRPGVGALGRLSVGGADGLADELASRAISLPALVSGVAATVVASTSLLPKCSISNNIVPY